MSTTSIEWTQFPGTVGRVWNPVRGCSRVSPGCWNCYAERQARRFSGPGQPYEGLTTLRGGRPGWTGAVRFVPDMLDAPLGWKKPSTVFVDSMSDLFHEKVTDEQIAAVLGVMAATPHHRYIVLTKRAERMRCWFEWFDDQTRTPFGDISVRRALADAYRTVAGDGSSAGDDAAFADLDCAILDATRPERDEPRWPLPNLILGVSCEDQATADERIPELLETPAACRVASLEPLLGPVELQNRRGYLEPFQELDPELRRTQRLDWVIAGGESGPGARPCDVEWLRSIVMQCEDAAVPCFVKQLGSDIGRSDPWGRFAGKASDPTEWPPALRVRQWPEVTHG